MLIIHAVDYSKTLLKLTIPRIKLLRNRREIQLKQMRRDIAKLLETGQEATARIRVEHIIREEKMMAAQEIIELFCELIAVRLPIIETQRECPIDLKEAISSVCFAAPRCADLPELMQVQMLFSGKYGKEFVTRATELMPECGVNRQLIELLSVRAPTPEAKLKLLKDIAEEHELDWDPSASENEMLKPHEDLLNGPTHFASGYKVPLPEAKHEEVPQGASEQTSGEKSDSDNDLETWEFPEVPKQPLKTNTGDISTPEMLPFPASALSELDSEPEKSTGVDGGLSEESHLKPDEILQKKSVTEEVESPESSVEEKQFLPFISPPRVSSKIVSAKQDDSSPSIPATKGQTDIDLQELLASARAAAETAERAAATARSAASLAELRINELSKRNEEVSGTNTENPFHAVSEKSNSSESPHLHHQSSSNDYHGLLRSQSTGQNGEDHFAPQLPHIPSYDDTKSDFGSFSSHSYVPAPGAPIGQFQRLPSMDDEFSYPNLFSSQGSHALSPANSFADNSRSTHE
ncbi:OLC1v1017534C1 [Oldenlandia corymbosa var. corymbosa]|uniref:OLC1v1017534C1 n=1 Tax=Oldenlandia corymbosa var. corymbosa TaxID=529605 RepID=A0AAV1E9R0_OLDCO|nr:OLC1v1017534C1 [Oldenlandia corymbosa var. corymbosa]